IEAEPVQYDWVPTAFLIAEPPDLYSGSNTPAIEATTSGLGMVRLRRGTSLWLDQYEGPALVAAPLRGRHVADVVIIGGGITACVTAERLARRGLHVSVLESKRIGRGSTSASTALLMQEPDVDFRD